MPGLMGAGGGIGGAETAAQPSTSQPWQSSSPLLGSGLPGMGLLSQLFGGGGQPQGSQPSSPQGTGQQGPITLSSLGLPDPLGQLLTKMGLPVPPLLPPGLPGLPGLPGMTSPVSQPAEPAQTPAAEPAPAATPAAQPAASTPPPTPAIQPGIRPQDLLRMSGAFLGAPSMGAASQNLMKTLGSSPFGWR